MLFKRRFVTPLAVAGCFGVVVSCSTDNKIVRGGVDTPSLQKGEVKEPSALFDTSRVVLGTEFEAEPALTGANGTDGQGTDVQGTGTLSGQTASGRSRVVRSIPNTTVNVPQGTQIVAPASLPQDSGAGGPDAEEVAAPVVYDQDFCKGLGQGECFTLVLQIPSPVLEQSPGLATLNLVQFSPSYRGVMARTCNEGLEVSWGHILKDQGVGLIHKQGAMRRAYPNVKRVRCILQNITSEEMMPVSLAQNEHGLAVRVVDFSIESKSTSTAPAFGTFEFKNAQMALKFRDPSAFAEGFGGTRSWRPVAGYDSVNIFRQTGVFPTATKRVNFSESLSFDFSLQGSAKYVQHVLMPVIDSASKGEGLGKLGFQLDLVRKQLSVLAAGSNPVVPALILAGIGVDAVRDLCTFETSDCRVKTTGENIGDIISSTYSTSSPIPAQTKATFVDATRYIPFAVMSAVVEGMDKKAYIELVGGK